MRSVLPWLPRGQARLVGRRDRRLPCASLRSRAAHDLREHRAPAQCASARVRACDQRTLRDPSLLVAATGTRRATTRALLDEAIELRLVADRPLGLFLSGRHRLRDDRVPARGNRASAAALVLGGVSGFAPRRKRGRGGDRARAARCPTSGSSCPRRSATTSREIVATLDEPFADPSSFPTWYLARGTERHVKVVLGGDGGDELFAGYKRVAKHLRNGVARHACACRCPCCRTCAPRAGARRSASSPSIGSPRTRCASRASRPTSGASCSRARDDCPRTTGARRTSTPRRRDDRLLRWDFANYLPEYVLRKADLATMAHGLELRAPLLDHRFVEAVLALPRARRASRRPPKLFLARLAPELERAGRVHAQEARLQSAARRLAQGRLARSPAGASRHRSRSSTARSARRRTRAGDDRRLRQDSLAGRADPVARHPRREPAPACGAGAPMAGSRAPMRYRERRAGARALGLAPAQAAGDAAAHPGAASPAARRHADADRAAREAARAVSRRPRSR